MNFWLDIGAVITSALILAGYQLFLSIKLRADPRYTIQALNIEVRTAWVEQIISRRDGILAVQTLRNSTMIATFLASTAMLLIVGVLTLSEQGDKLGSAWHSLSLFGSRDPEWWIFKLLLLLVDLFFAFFAFAVSIRIYNHVGYMINVPVTGESPAVTVAHVASHLNRAGHFYGMGMRAYFYLVPCVFWLFGPLLMLISAAGLVAVLYNLDRSPKPVIPLS